MLDYNIVIVGAAGEGIQSVGEALLESLASCGYRVFAWQEFESRIRGGQSSFSLRITDRPVNAPAYRADILLALNEAAKNHYLGRLKPGGLVVCEGDAGENGLVLRVPFVKTARDSLGNRLYANSIAVGVLAALAGMEPKSLESVLLRRFADKGEAVAAGNAKAFETGFELGQKHKGLIPGLTLPCGEGGSYVLSGHEAFCVGAYMAGLRFISAYPMSPSTSIITWFAENREKLDVFVEQAEDEISALNMAIGASFAGARAMTATSGGGFDLMTEALSLAGMAETPVVIVVAQRPGPSTGLPTRTAQGDLLAVVHSGHGEFARAVLAPSDAEDAVKIATRAFDLAERFQIPVLVLTDQFLADSRFCLPSIDEGWLVRNDHLADPKDVNAPYKRYRLTQSGVSPRLYPGQSEFLVCADSDEHDETGHITEDLAQTVPRMVEKRLAKMESLRAEMKPPRWHGPADAQTLLVGWGSTRGALMEAVDVLCAKNQKTALVHFTELWPLPEYAFPANAKLVAVEGNATGQFEGLLKAAYGVEFSSIRRFDGLPLDAGYIVGKLTGGA